MKRGLRVVLVLVALLVAAGATAYSTSLIYRVEGLLGRKLEETPGRRHLSPALVQEARRLMRYGSSTTYWNARQTDRGEPMPYVTGQNPNQELSGLSNTFGELDPDW